VLGHVGVWLTLVLDEAGSDNYIVGLEAQVIVSYEATV
jgi:hypothetical protein